MKRLLRRVGNWFDARLRFSELMLPVMRHPIPRPVAGAKGWWYVFGSASMTLFFIQILTGIGLAMVFVPAADKAYDSLNYLNHQQPFGWFLRSVHYWSGSLMMVMVLVHLTQVFLHGAYKYPRELTWVLGVFLLLSTVGLMFSGQVLRWDADAYWGLGVGTSMAGRVPWIGPAIVQVMLGGPVIGGDTLSRFFALHVFILPSLLLTVLAAHLWLVVVKGVSAPPKAGEVVDPKTYDASYEKELKRGKPFMGEAARKDALFSALVVLLVVVLAAVVGPKGPNGLPDPAVQGANPRPDWPFLWLFGLLSLAPAGLETFLMLVFPALLVLGLLLVPFVSNRGERAPSRRPVAVLAVLVGGVALAVLTYAGATAPWSPQMDAWSGAPVPEKVVAEATPRELLGAAVLQNKSCRNCHALNGSGGRRGPDLAGVGARLTRNQLIDQVSNGTPGGGDMPAYGAHMSPAEMDALADFLASLRPAGRPPSKTPTR
jgi:ubiquinol-cytochrome c reductase cytochrome b subunit